MKVVRRLALAGALVLLLLGAAPALADTYVGGTPPNAGVNAGSVNAGGVHTASVNVGGGRSVSSSGLAFTGADILGLLAIAVAVVAAGTVVVRLARRPATA